MINNREIIWSDSEELLERYCKENGTSILNVLAVKLMEEKNEGLLIQEDYLGKLAQWKDLYENTIEFGEDEHENKLSILKNRTIGLGMPSMLKISNHELNKSIWFKDQYQIEVIKRDLLTDHYHTLFEYNERLRLHSKSLAFKQGVKGYLKYTQHYQQVIDILTEYLEKLGNWIEIKTNRIKKINSLIDRKTQLPDGWLEIFYSMVNPISAELTHEKLTYIEGYTNNVEYHKELMVYIATTMSIHRKYLDGSLPEIYYISEYQKRTYEMLSKVKMWFIPSIYKWIGLS